MNEQARSEVAPPRRGPGRPPGSRNKSKEPPLTWIEHENLTRRLSVEYAEAVTAAAIAQTRLRGIKALAERKLGASGLYEIEAALGNTREEIVADRQ